MLYPKPVVPGGSRGAMADQLTLSQPGGGAYYAHQIILAPPDFQNFLRPCINPNNIDEIIHCAKLSELIYLWKKNVQTFSLAVVIPSHLS